MRENSQNGWSGREGVHRNNERRRKALKTRFESNSKSDTLLSNCTAERLVLLYASKMRVNEFLRSKSVMLSIANKCRRGLERGCLLVVALLCLALPIAHAQSLEAGAPTPISARDLSGSIAARDIGDSRFT